MSRRQPEYGSLPRPSVVCTPGILGGRPRLDGTRLSVAWFAANDGMPKAAFAEHWPYLTEAHLDFMAAVIHAVKYPDGE